MINLYGKSLERDLGLPSVLAISIGAMVGSGIFILPGLAMKMAGPAVVLAYFIAALLVLPAALSKSEMATAMPEAGGTYLYIERGLGSVLGTIAGVGTWFSLTFKSGLALVGGAPYIIILLDLPVEPVAVGLAILLILVNIFGVKQTGRMQVVIVSIMLLVLGWFIIGGTSGINTGNYEGTFDSGITGLLGATGFVFVSYAGVTKVASIAEEIENPDKNIPQGILGSLVFTTLIYVAIVAVMVGVTPASELTSSDVPMYETAQYILPWAGEIAIVVAAVLALISTANAGLLSSSRYPLAMSRDGLVPESLEEISDRFNTPVRSISLTGAVLLFLIIFVDINQIAKLASAFQILVFIIINLALVAFREGDVDGYDPSFKAPLYPIPQAFGVIGGLIILPFLGLLPILGAVGITVGSLIWYWAYVYRQGGNERESAMTDVIRRKVGKEIIKDTESEIDADEYEILVALHEGTKPDQKRELLSLATTIAEHKNGNIRVEQYDEVPLQTPLQNAVDIQTEEDEVFEDILEDCCDNNPDINIQYEEVSTHFTGHAIVNRAKKYNDDLIITEQHNATIREQVLGSQYGWLETKAPCDVIEASGFDRTELSSVSVLTDESPYDPGKVSIADAISSGIGIDLNLYYISEEVLDETQEKTISDYHAELKESCSSNVESDIITNEELAELEEQDDTSSLVIVSADDTRRSIPLLNTEVDQFGSVSDSIVFYGATYKNRVFDRIAERLF